MRITAAADRDKSGTRTPRHPWQHWVGLACFMAALLATQFLTAEEPVSKPAAPKWKPLFDGKTLKNWKSSQFGGEGDIEVKEGSIVMQQGSEMTGLYPGPIGLGANADVPDTG